MVKRLLQKPDSRNQRIDLSHPLALMQFQLKSVMPVRYLSISFPSNILKAFFSAQPSSDPDTVAFVARQCAFNCFILSVKALSHLQENLYTVAVFINDALFDLTLKPYRIITSHVPSNPTNQEFAGGTKSLASGSNLRATNGKSKIQIQVAHHRPQRL